MNPAEIHDKYVEIVSHPGKFEGEAAYSPYFYDSMLNGDGEWINDTEQLFWISPEDILIFPDLKGFEAVLCTEDEQGFWYCSPMNSKNGIWHLEKKVG